ncbi:MAG: hypothetical protein K0S39_4 [Paenibacillus sp.]|jgi:hypothetical protein|nr:hypothetical protein [Paenibacillus sp.]
MRGLLILLSPVLPFSLLTACGISKEAAAEDNRKHASSHGTHHEQGNVKGHTESGAAAAHSEPAENGHGSMQGAVREHGANPDVLS